MVAEAQAARDWDETQRIGVQRGVCRGAASAGKIAYGPRDANAQNLAGAADRRKKVFQRDRLADIGRIGTGDDAVLIVDQRHRAQEGRIAQGGEKGDLSRREVGAAIVFCHRGGGRQFGNMQALCQIVLEAAGVQRRDLIARTHRVSVQTPQGVAGDCKEPGREQ